MQTLFDPAILLLSETEWLDDTKRDKFLEHLLHNLTNISDYELTKICWTDELEEILWHHPQLPPWRLQRDWKLSVVPILYRLFSQLVVFLDEVEDTGPCNVQPALTYSYNRPEIHQSFLCLTHYLIGAKEQLYFCVGLENQLPDGRNYSFYSSLYSLYLEPILINSADDWLKYVDLITNYWPVTYNRDEVEKFRIAIKITIKVHLLVEEKDTVYSYRFEKKFIESICKEQQCREAILYSIAKRLVLPQVKASSDKSLHDEPLRGQKKGQRHIRRFRVTQENRIHYEYSGENEILFLEYYGAGQHDRGL